MQIVTEPDVAGYADDHPWSRQFKVIGYRDGGYSYIPHGFFRNWLDEEPKESRTAGSCSWSWSVAAMRGSNPKESPVGWTWRHSDKALRIGPPPDQIAAFGA